MHISIVKQLRKLFSPRYWHVTVHYGCGQCRCLLNFVFFWGEGGGLLRGLLTKNLTCWIVLFAISFLVQNLLDAMHAKYNIADSLKKFIFGKKDTLECQRDMEEFGILYVLWLWEIPSGGWYTKSSAHLYED